MIPTIALFDRNYVPQAGDLHIENPAAPRLWIVGDRYDSPSITETIAATSAEEAIRLLRAKDPMAAALPDGEVYARESPLSPTVIDPQHGGHRPGESWPVVEPGDAACTYALRLLPALDAPPARVVLLPSAGVDDYAAAAVLGVHPRDVTDAMRQRLADLAAADNAILHAQGEEWRPGYCHAVTVGDRLEYGGLGRIAACRALPPALRVDMFREWVLAGEISISIQGLHYETLQILGVTTLPVEDRDNILPSLDAIAREEREASYAACRVSLWGPSGPIVTDEDGWPAEDGGESPLVALVISQMQGLSAGRGAFVVGYQRAPVVIAHSPAERLYTVGRASNAKRVQMDFAKLVAALNEAEVAADGAGGWGGNPTSGILGSPKPAGSCLVPARVTKIVLRHVRQIPPSLTATCSFCGATTTEMRPCFRGLCDTCGAQALATPSAPARPPMSADELRAGGWDFVRRGSSFLGQDITYHFRGPDGVEYDAPALKHLLGIDWEDQVMVVREMLAREDARA